MHATDQYAVQQHRHVLPAQQRMIGHCQQPELDQSGDQLTGGQRAGLGQHDGLGSEVIEQAAGSSIGRVGTEQTSKQ